MAQHHRNRLARAAFLAATGLVLTLGAACQLPGDTFVVTTTVDALDAAPGDGVCETVGGECSLRAAITEANASSGLANVELGDGATYTLSIGGQDEDLGATGDLDVTQTTAINGRSTIDGAGLDRVLDVRAGTLFLEGPTIVGGTLAPNEYDAANERGGGIRVASGAQLVGWDITVEDNVAWHGGGGISAAGSVALERSTVRDNRTEGGQLSFEGAYLPAHGGGIELSAGQLTLTDSSVSGNVIDTYGTGSAVYGSGAAAVTLVRSTVSDNQFALSAAVSAPTLTVTTSTVSANTASAALSGATLTITGSTVVQGGGVAVQRLGTASVQGSILAASAGSACSGPVTSLGWSIATDTSCGLAAPGDQQATDPFLQPLGNNGGPTETQLPFAGSPALDAIPAGTTGLCDGSSPVDQRGQVRPAGSACDIGAVEGSSSSSAAPLTLTVDDAGPAHDVTPGDGLCTTPAGGCTLPAAVDETNSWPPADTITIAPGIDPVLAPADGLDVTDELTIHGGGATVAFATAAPILTTSAAVSVDRMRIAGPGSIRVQAGAATFHEITIDRSWVRIEAGADATITRSAITGSVSSSGHATIDRSTISSFSGYALQAYGTGGAGAGVDVVMSTIVGSSRYDAGYAPAIAQQGLGVPIRVRGSVIAGGAGGGCDPGFRPTSLGYNVVGDTSCAFAATGDQQGVTPLVLGPAANGGPTATRLLYANSPAVNAIPSGTAGLCDASIPTDQRGLPRKVGPACDAGATEGPSAVTATAPISIAVDRSEDASDEVPGDGVCLATSGGCPLRAAVDEANAWPFADTITINAGIAPVLTIAGQLEDQNATGDLDLLDAVTVTGSGNVVDGGGLDRVFDVHAGTSTLRSITVRGSGDPGYDPGAVRSGSPLTLRSMIISNNGTGGVLAHGPLTVISASITDNAGTGITGEGTTSIDRATVARNTGTGIKVYGSAAIARSTVSGNGDYAVSGSGTASPLTIIASTLVGGSSFAVFVDFGRPTTLTAVSVTNTNPASAVCANMAGAATSYSRTTDATCGTGTGTAVVASLGLGPLTGNGGSTATHLPDATSDLLDAVPVGVGSCVPYYSTDQRALPRPSGPACDVGAVERQP